MKTVGGFRKTRVRGLERVNSPGIWWAPPTTWCDWHVSPPRPPPPETRRCGSPLLGRSSATRAAQVDRHAGARSGHHCQLQHAPADRAVDLFAIWPARQAAACSIARRGQRVHRRVQRTTRAASAVSTGRLCSDWTWSSIRSVRFGCRTARACSSACNCSRSKGARMVSSGGITDIVTGRRPIGDLSQLVADWRSKGGDKMRAEFEQALAG
jgi:hypothetical protein